METIDLDGETMAHFLMSLKSRLSQWGKDHPLGSNYDRMTLVGKNLIDVGEALGMKWYDDNQPTIEDKADAARRVGCDDGC